MNASYRASHEYAKWIDKLVQAHISKELLDGQTAESYLQANARFITLTFDKRMINRRKSDLNDSSGVRADPRLLDINRLNAENLSPEFFNVDRLYKTVCQALLGTNWSRAGKRKQQPLMIAVADVNGTRYGRPTSNENLHMHSLWVCKTHQIEAFDAAIERIKNDPRHALDFDEIDVAPIHNMAIKSNGATRLSSYMAKFLGMNASEMAVGQDLAIYPRHSHEAFAQRNSSGCGGNDNHDPDHFRGSRNRLAG
ncbi:hypothetical protein [Rhizobium sp. PL01]|uniref:hypothetical protein n=1 Tax=Rhizobium sp. PL01 TaxID=3085631 RepID=UPI0029810B46|nr:hypothetical protein [Rhizobium sp. PL01]MDW5316428.1 hypothetical protein [Rhizobium sp. PL01]